jgi:hypothetical protein
MDTKEEVRTMKKKTAPIRVEIKPGNPPTADPYVLDISKKGADRVEWSSKVKDWAVVFEGLSPFKRLYFIPGQHQSGNIVVDSGPTEYSYTVYVNGKKSNSPQIKISP